MGARFITSVDVSRMRSRRMPPGRRRKSTTYLRLTVPSKEPGIVFSSGNRACIASYDIANSHQVQGVVGDSWVKTAPCTDFAGVMSLCGNRTTHQEPQSPTIIFGRCYDEADHMGWLIDWVRWRRNFCRQDGVRGQPCFGGTMIWGIDFQEVGSGVWVLQPLSYCRLES